MERNSLNITIAVKIDDIASAVGCANQTPSKPRNLGSINIIGISIITCLNKLNTIAIFALPVD